MANLPDVNGRVGQDFAVAVPAAVGGGAPASRVVSTDLAEDLAFAALPQVQLQVRVALAVAGREAETPHSVDLHEAQVELERVGRRERFRRRARGAGTPAGPDPTRGTEAGPGLERRLSTWSSLLVCRSRCLRKSKREHFRTRMRSVVPSAR